MDWLKNITGTLEDVGTSAGNIYKAFEKKTTPTSATGVSEPAKFDLSGYGPIVSIGIGVVALIVVGFLAFRK